MTGRYMFIALWLLVHGAAQGQSPADRFQWSTVFSSGVGSSVVADEGFVVWSSGMGAWSSPDGETFRPILDAEGAARVRQHMIVAEPSGGPLLIAGTQGYLGEIVSACMVDSLGTVTWLPESIVSQIDGRGLRGDPRAMGLTDSIYILEAAVSTDAGATWVNVPDPSVGSLSAYTYHPGIGIVARHQSSRAWYACPIRGDRAFEWQPYNLEVEFGLDSTMKVGELYVIHGGRTLAIIENNGMASAFRYRARPGDAWIPLNEITTGSGPSADTLNLRGMQSAWTIRRYGAQRVCVATDSGGVLLVDARGIRSTLLGEARRQFVRRGRMFKGAIPRFLPVVYPESIYVLDTNLTVLLQTPTMRLFPSAEFAVGETNRDGASAPLLFALSSGTGGLGWIYNPEAGQWRATMRWVDAIGQTQQPAYFWSVLGFGLDSTEGWLIHALRGDLMQLSPSGTALHLQPTPHRTVYRSPITNIREYGFGERRYAALGNRVMRLSYDARDLASDTATPVGIDTITAIAEDRAGRVYAAYKSIYRHTSVGTPGGPDAQWDRVLYRDDADSIGTISDLIAVGDTLLAGVRGFRRAWSGVTLYHATGGVLRSTDAGESWTRSALPVSTPAQSVETLYLTRSGAILAWVREVEIAGDTSRRAQLGVYEASAWLLRSTDGGQTWDSVLTMQHPQRSTVRSTWRIIQDGEHDATIYTCAGRDGLYRSDDEGVTWSRVEIASTSGLPVVDVAVRSANGSDSDVLIAFEDELAFLGSVTSIEQSSTRQSRSETLVAYPVPATGNLTLRWITADHDSRLYNVLSCVVVDASGQVVANLTQLAAQNVVALTTTGWNLNYSNCSFPAPGWYRLIMTVTGHSNATMVRCSIPLIWL